MEVISIYRKSKFSGRKFLVLSTRLSTKRGFEWAEMAVNDLNECSELRETHTYFFTVYPAQQNEIFPPTQETT